ncbi:MAG: hypothetical protein FWD36_07545 [Treponema sp.]|nr:hypothetical protein [Treponema sp.]
MHKKQFWGLMTLLAVFLVLSCNTEADPVSSGLAFTYPERYQVVPAWTNFDEETTIAVMVDDPLDQSLTGGDTVKYLDVIYYEREGGIDNYVIYLGHINNVPIASGAVVDYDGRTPMSVGRAQSESVAETVSESIKQTITESTTSTNTQSRRDVSAKLNLSFFSAGASSKVSNTTTTHSTTTARSFTDTFQTAQTKTNSTTDTVSVTVGNNGEPAGRYRITLFATTDVYFTVRLDRHREVVGTPEISICARVPSYTYRLDYDPITLGNFGRTDEGEMLPIPYDFSSLYALAQPDPVPFVAIGLNGRMANSEDGINWTQIAVGTTAWNGIAFGNNEFMAVRHRTGANTDSNPFYNIAFSASGTANWTETFVGNTVIVNNNNSTSIEGNFNISNWDGITYANGTWLAVGRSDYSWGSTNTSSGRIAYSTNGVEWTVLSVGTAINGNSKYWSDVIYANDRWVAVGTSGRMTNSVNATSWVTPYFEGSANWNKITYGNNRFVVVGDEGRMAYSPDGLFWTHMTVGAYTWNSVKYGNSVFVATGSTVGGFGRMAYSMDGIDWTEIIVGTSNWIDVTYGNGLWIAVGGIPGNVGRMAYSTDGINWTEITVGTAGLDYWHGITFGM